MKLNQQDIDAKNATEFLEKLKNGKLPYRFRRELAKYETSVVESTTASLLQKVVNNTEIDTFELKRVVVVYNRPSLIVKNGKIQSSPSDYWREMIDSKANLFSELLPSVGRIELKNHERYDWVGTGFLIDNDKIITNRHVAIEFFENNGDGFCWRKNPHNMRTIKSRIDFIEEHESPDELEYEISDALYISNEDKPDIAILKLNNLPESITPLELLPPEKNLAVLAVGYPWRDPRVSFRLQRIHESIFGDAYEVKRAAPGIILNLSGSTFNHDCSLLDGNSGSPLLDFETGKVVGIHFGARGNKNYAVSAEHLQEVVDQL